MANVHDGAAKVATKLLAVMPQMTVSAAEALQLNGEETETFREFFNYLTMLATYAQVAACRLRGLTAAQRVEFAKALEPILIGDVTPETLETIFNLVQAAGFEVVPTEAYIAKAKTGR